MESLLRKLRWWHAVAAFGVATAVCAYLFVFLEPHDASPITWEYKLDGSSTPADLERAKGVLAARLAPSSATVRVADGKIVVTLPHNDDHEEMIADTEIIDEHLRAVPPRIELMFFDDGNPYLQLLTDRVRRDRSAAALGIGAATDRRQLAGTDVVDHYLEAANKDRHVNTAWALRKKCVADEAEAARDRIEGLGVYCTVSGADLIRAYLEGDDDLGVPPLEGFSPPATGELLFAPTANGWRTHLLGGRLLLDGNRNVIDVRADGDRLRVKLPTDAADAIAARYPKQRVAATVDGNPMPTQFSQDGRQAELTIDFGKHHIVSDLVFAFDVAALPGKLVLLRPHAPTGH